MEGQRWRVPSFFTKFAGSVREKVDNDLNIRYFTKRQIKNITDNYNTELAKGGFSEVYKGRLDDGRPVAVKRLLGCCVEADAPMLVTELVPNGNLSDLLHGLSAQVRLSLDKRLQIASDVAEGLVYMHTSQSHPILHGDIKSENIFLDNNYMPKLSDFGISRLLSLSSKEYTRYVLGSIGYMDPEFCQTGRLSTKSDVYSFGVVLLELMTRRKAIDDNEKLLVKKFGLANTVSSRHELFDKDIAKTDQIMKVLDDIVDLALECVKFELEKRPDMREVSECLRKIQRTLEDKPCQIWAPLLIQRTPEEKHCQEIISSLKKTGFERFITKDRIYKMTDNFRSFPTEYFMGNICRGNLGGIPSMAIIKMPFEIHSSVSKAFTNQMVLHSALDHQNVVKFAGCCLDGDVAILVYMSNYGWPSLGLHDILFGDGSNDIFFGDGSKNYFLKELEGLGNKNLTFNFDERLRTAKSIAKGLCDLHSLGIVHGDIRTASVLVVNGIPKNGLMHNVQIKVSGIGASVYFSMAEAAHETIKAEENNGYIDPIFLKTGVLKKYADVYSFGVVLLELFTGKKVSNQIRNCRLEELWDNTNCSHIQSTRTLAFRCLDPNVKSRPTFLEAVKVFECAMTGIYSDRCDGNFCDGFYDGVCAARKIG
ncbi:hypothetical protein EJB05_24104, partial [Eragrostis curvula]